MIYTKVKGMPARKYFKINSDAEVLLALLREKIQHEPPPKTDKPNDGSGSDSGGGTPENMVGQKGETSIDEMLKQGSAVLYLQS